jgi:hypothetical protein
VVDVDVVVVEVVCVAGIVVVVVVVCMAGIVVVVVKVDVEAAVKVLGFSVVAVSKVLVIVAETAEEICVV